VIAPKTKASLIRGVVWLVLILIALAFLIPLLVAVNTAFKPEKEIYQVTALPTRLYLDNLRVGFQRVGRSLLNSLLIAFPAMLLSTFIGTLAAYPLSQLQFKGDTFVYLFLLAGMYIPYQTVLIPAFLIVRKVGLYNRIPGLWLIHMAYGIPFTTLILRNFFATIPGELREASTIDGCSLVAYYWRILLPVGRTGIATVLILQFRGSWNDFLFSLTMIRSPERYPATVMLQSFITAYELQWGPMMAATCFTIIPTIIVLLIFKRHFVAGLTGVYK
jgi:ABC-type glycerol-3-phosphate transport system permease component